MSQYIPGVVDYVPEIQPFKPNLNFYQSVLETKNAQYKEGYNKLSGLYGQLLESPLLRTENIELRNKFFNDIGNQIKKISSMDLSMPQNVEAASKIFQPIIDNKYMLKDMAYTQRAYSALAKGQRLKDDPNSQDKYWEGGIRAIQYQMMDFSQSSAEDSLKYNAPDYTPYVNVSEKAMKFAKDMGFNVTNLSFSPDGRYQIISKNGIQMVPSLTNAFISVFKNDQSAIDYYKTLSFLNRRDYMSQNAAQFGSEEAAEKNYLRTFAQQLQSTFTKAKDDAERDLKSVDVREKAADVIISGKGINLQDSKDQDIVRVKQQSAVEKLIALSSKEFYENSEQTINENILLSSGINAERSRIDAAVANNLFASDLYNAAVSYAMNTAEIKDIKADQYALASFEDGLARNRMVLDYALKFDFEKQKAALDILKEQLKEKGSPTSFTPQGNDLVTKSSNTGGAAVIDNLIESDKAVISNTGDGLVGAISQYAVTVNEKLKQYANAQPGETINGIYIKDENQARQIRDYAKQKQIELFKNANTKIEEEKSPAFGGALNYLGPFSFGAAIVADTLFGQKTAKTTYSDGYLKEDGNLIDFKNAPFYRDGKNKNNWYYLNDRLKKASADPLFAAMIAGDVNIQSAAGQVISAEKTYYAQKKIQGDNNKLVFSAVLSNPSTGVSSILNNTYSPEYSKKFVQDNFVKSNGDLISKEEFVNKYVQNHPIVEKQKGSYYYMTEGVANPGTYKKDDYKDQAEEIYDKMLSSFVKTYNQGPDATIGTSGMKSVKYAFTAGGEGGAGVQQGAIGYSNIDAAFPMDIGSQDFMKFMNIVEQSLPTGGVLGIVNEDGDRLNSEMLEDIDIEEETSSQLFNILNSVKSTMIKGVDKKDAKRPNFSFYHHGIIGNDPNKIGFTITLDPNYVSEGKGNSKTAGITDPLSANNNSITVILDANKVDKRSLNSLNMVGALERGIEDLEMEATGVVNVSEYNEYGGSAVIEKAGDRYRVTTRLKSYDQNGKLVENVNSTLSDPMASPSSIAKSLRPYLSNLSEQNYMISEQIRQMGNLQYDPSVFSK